MCIYKVIYFIFEISKTVIRKKKRKKERKKKIIYDDANQNLNLIKYLIFLKCFSVFFKTLLSLFLAFSSSLLALFFPHLR